jgi:hypothetical protein
VVLRQSHGNNGNLQQRQRQSGTFTVHQQLDKFFWRRFSHLFVLLSFGASFLTSFLSGKITFDSFESFRVTSLGTAKSLFL